MRVCFVSYGSFPDGPLVAPVLESDAVNIAYALGGDFASYYQLRQLPAHELPARLASYDLILATLEPATLPLVLRLEGAAPGRLAPYSEGHVGQYQALGPADQAAYVGALRGAALNCIYWEKYQPFYEGLGQRPVIYLPYPYLLGEARRHWVPQEARRSLAVVPTGLAGQTRNGLASLSVLRQLLERGLVDEADCWPDADLFHEDVQAVCYVLFPGAEMPNVRRDRLAWRHWLLRSRLDYRPLLKLWRQLRPRQGHAAEPIRMRRGPVTFNRRTGWTAYLAQLAQARLLIDLNNRETVGRNALDCAALGVPCLSTDRSDLQVKLWPRTTLADSWDVPGALRLAEHLLTEPSFYASVVREAAEKVEAFALPAFRDRFERLVARHPSLAGAQPTATAGDRA